MGATVTTGRCASAFRAATGAVVYVLFEETYEKNCYPHTPSWSCIGFGEIQDVLRRVFAIAGDCEGGMLQNRSGRITPEGYLRSWMQTLSAPAEQMNFGIGLRFGSGRYGTFSDEERDAVLSTLTSIGRTDIAATLLAGNEAALRLHEDIPALLALHKDLGISAWRLLSSASPRREEFNAALGYNPKAARTFPVSVPAALRVGEHDRLLQHPDGSWYCAGWAYSIIGNFISELWQEEWNYPGSFKKRITAYRDAVEHAPRVPLDQLKVVLDLAISVEDKYAQRSIDEVQRANPVTATETGFEVIPTEENLYRLAHLPGSNTRWVVSPDWMASHLPADAQPALLPLTA